MARFDFGESLAIISQLVAYIIGIVIIIQIIKALFSGTWQIEEIILALVIFNLTITFGVGGYLIHLNNKISTVNTKLEGHFGWHRGVEMERKTSKKK